MQRHFRYIYQYPWINLIVFLCFFCLVIDNLDTCSCLKLKSEMDGPVAVITDSYYHDVWNDTKAAIEFSEWG